MPKGTSIILTEENIRDFDKKKKFKENKTKKEKLIKFLPRKCLFFYCQPNRD